jgi:hypothetical protein
LALATESEQLLRFSQPIISVIRPGTSDQSQTLRWLQGNDAIIPFASQIGVGASSGDVTLGGLAPPITAEEWEVFAVWVQDQNARDTTDTVKILLNMQDEVPGPYSSAFLGLRTVTGLGSVITFPGLGSVTEWKWQPMDNVGNLYGIPVRLRRQAPGTKSRSITVIVNTTATAGTRTFWCFAYVRKRRSD